MNSNVVITMTSLIVAKNGSISIDLPKSPSGTENIQFLKSLDELKNGLISPQELNLPEVIDSTTLCKLDDLLFSYLNSHSMTLPQLLTYESRFGNYYLPRSNQQIVQVLEELNKKKECILDLIQKVQSGEGVNSLGLYFSVDSSNAASIPFDSCSTERPSKAIRVELNHSSSQQVENFNLIVRAIMKFSCDRSMVDQALAPLLRTSSSTLDTRITFDELGSAFDRLINYRGCCFPLKHLTWIIDSIYKGHGMIKALNLSDLQEHLAANWSTYSLEDIQAFDSVLANVVSAIDIDLAQHTTLLELSNFSAQRLTKVHATLNAKMSRLFIPHCITAQKKEKNPAILTMADVFNCLRAQSAQKSNSSYLVFSDYNNSWKNFLQSALGKKYASSATVFDFSSQVLYSYLLYPPATITESTYPLLLQGITKINAANAEFLTLQPLFDSVHAFPRATHFDLSGSIIRQSGMDNLISRDQAIDISEVLHPSAPPKWNWLISLTSLLNRKGDVSIIDLMGAWSPEEGILIIPEDVAKYLRENFPQVKIRAATSHDLTSIFDSIQKLPFFFNTAQEQTLAAFGEGACYLRPSSEKDCFTYDRWNKQQNKKSSVRFTLFSEKKPDKLTRLIEISELNKLLRKGRPLCKAPYTIN